MVPVMIPARAIRATPCSAARMSGALQTWPLVFSFCILYFQFEGCLLYLSLLEKEGLCYCVVTDMCLEVQTACSITHVLGWHK